MLKLLSTDEAGDGFGVGEGSGVIPDGVVVGVTQDGVGVGETPDGFEDRAGIYAEEVL